MTETTLTFVHISDTHIDTDPDFTGEHIDFSSREPVIRLIETINNLEAHVDFVMHTGDIMQDPQSADDYEVARTILGKIKYPTYYIPGNHDHPIMMQTGFLQRNDVDIVTNYDYQFIKNGVQVIMLDSHHPLDEDGPHGTLAPSQIQWLDSICSSKATYPLVVGIHHHVLPLQAPWLDSFGLTNGDEVHHVLLKARHRLRGVFYGHIHEAVVTMRDGISYYSVPSGWFQTRTWHNAQQPVRDTLHNPGFNLVTVTRDDLFVRFRRIQI